MTPETREKKGDELSARAVCKVPGCNAAVRNIYIYMIICCIYFLSIMFSYNPLLMDYISRTY